MNEKSKETQELKPKEFKQGGSRSNSRKRSRNGKKKEDQGKKPSDPKIPKNGQTSDPKGDVVPTQVNDPMWYAINETIGQSIAQIPFSYPAGLKNNLAESYATNDTTPSTMRISYVPSYGKVGKLGDAVNTAARAMFAVVKKKNRNSIAYEAADLMTYFMAMDQLITLMMEAKRALSFASSYAAMNRSLPNTLAEAAGVDLSSIQDDYASYVGRWNVLAETINRQFAIPKTFKLFNRRNLLASNIFMDSTSIRGQYYVFRAYGYFTWSGTVAGGSSLKYNRRSLVVQTMDEVLTEISGIVNALIEEQDISIMVGDVINAFGDQDILQIELMDINAPAVIKPVVDENVLQQIENMSYFPTVVIGDITQDSNVLMQDTHITLDTILTKVVNCKYPFNSHKDKPDWRDVLEFSRNMAALGEVYQTNLCTLIYGSEIFVDISIYRLSAIGKGEVISTSAALTNVGANVDISSDSTTQSFASGYFHYIFDLSQFDWHPWQRMWLVSDFAGIKSEQFTGILADFKVTAFVDATLISSLHDCAMLSLLDITMLDKMGKS